MKLTSVHLFPVGLTCLDLPPTWGNAHRRHVLVRVVADNGVAGWGEITGLDVAAPLAPDPRRLEAALRQELAGIDARDFGLVAMGLGRWLGESAVARHVRCGIDLALHDLVGRARGEPVHRLLGGAVRATLRVAYAIGAHRQTEDVPASVAYVGDRLARGFDLLRCYIGLNEQADALFLQGLRETYGDRVTIKTLDCNGHLDATAALQAIDRYREYGPFLLIESPARRGDVAGLAAVRRAIPFPVSEHADTPAAALALLQAGAVDIVNVRCISLGGLTVARQVAAMAEAAGVHCVLGAAHELNVGTAAQAHLGAALPEHAFPADCIGPEIYDDDLTVGRLVYEGSTLHVPTEPGLGFTVDETKVARYAV